MDTGPAYSFFYLVDTEFRSSMVMRRIFSLARKAGYGSFVVDEIGEADCPLLVEENVALRKRLPEYSHSRVRKISFFATPKAISPVPTSAFLGYAVFKEDFVTSQPNRPKAAHVFEAVMKPFRQKAENNFVHCCRKYAVRTSVGDFTTEGVLYAQQNDITFVCAHVSLRTALSTVLPAGDVTYQEMNKTLGIDHTTRRVGGGIGLGPDDIEAVLRSHGIVWRTYIHEPKARVNLKQDYQRYLYGSIECGMPALLGFETRAEKKGKPADRHMICAFGHTFNEDAWVPAAHPMYFSESDGYFPSENWLSTFVIHDDNVGPYQCVPRHYITNKHFRLLIGLQRQAASLYYIEAEAVAFLAITRIRETDQSDSVSSQDDYWYHRFKIFARFNGIVIRTLMLKRQEYIDHLIAIDAWNEKLSTEHLTLLNSALPDWVWVSEVSTLELFQASRRKFGEIIMRCDPGKGKTTFEKYFIAARLPRRLFMSSKSLKKPEITTVKSHAMLFSF
ncbi:MAG TPA: hypothetical protein VNW30_09160 [Opitutaceae bacterium]|nr:hypothetical protein [Opitutaceae bacterium]